MESDITNNCGPAVAVTVSAPDLVINEIEPSRDILNGEQFFTLRVTVLNSGGALSTDTTLRYYLSSNNDIDTSDMEIGDDSVSDLYAAESDDEDLKIQVPAGRGTYYYGVCVDPVSGESDTTNNCSRAVRIYVEESASDDDDEDPDLVVESPTVSSASLAPGASFTLTVNVRNSGGGESSLTDLYYYRSGDDNITTGDTRVGDDRVSRLDDGETDDEDIDLTAPTSAGTYYYGACVDSFSSESNSNNNCSEAVSVTVTSGTTTSDDHGDTRPAATALPLGSSGVAGSIETGDDVDYFRINVTGAGALSVYTTGSLDTLGSLESSAGVEIVGNDDSGSGNNFLINRSVSSGTYYVKVTSYSSNTGNYRVYAGIAGGGGSPSSPDLVVNTPSVSASSVETGQSFTLSATVRNSGSGSSAATTLRYYRSSNSTIDSGDTRVGSDSVSSLTSGGTSDESISLTAPASGTYYYGACVESVSGESNTGNNCSSGTRVTVTAAVPPSSPDLVVDAPAVSSNHLNSGQSFTLSATVRNRGGGSSAATTLRYYRSSNSTIDTSDTRVGTDNVSGLSAGGTSDESISLTAPSGGTYYYGACVVSVGGESNTGNNCSSGERVTVTTAPAAAPDLVVDPPTFSPSDLVSRQPFTLSVTVRNRGSGLSPFTYLRYYRSSNSTITTIIDEQVGGNYGITDLPAGGTRNQSIRLTAPAGGEYYYGACVESVAGESNTGNNCSEGVLVPVTTDAPDLIVSDVSFNPRSSVRTAHLDPGDPFNLYATIGNIGLSRAGGVTVDYYHSTDANIISYQDTKVGTDTLSFGLAAGADNSENISLDAPTTPGAHYYGACVSGDGEATTSNNCSDAVTIVVDDYGDTYSEASNILSLGVLSNSVSGVIEHGSDVDYFSFAMPSGVGHKILIYTTGSLDTVGTLYDRSGTQEIVSDDNSGAGSNFRISRETQPPAHLQGTYYIKVESKYSFTSGSYTLHISRVE